MNTSGNGNVHCRILVVDDNLTVLHTLVLVLESQGYSVKSATNSEDAVRCVSSFRPQILITDVQLAGRNGVDTALQILQMMPACHVLLMSGDTTAGVILAAAKARGQEFDILPKPTDPRTLFAKLRSYRVA